MDGINGCGIGLRREFLSNFLSLPQDSRPDWIEITPENWIYTPRKYRDDFEAAISDYPLVAHGLSLSPGSIDEIDMTFIRQMKQFLDRHNIQHYSEHMSFSSLGGAQTYELLPLPMTRKMAHFIADKLKKLRDLLDRPVILENATYYFIPYAEMDESEFINLVLELADTTLLLDVNNVYVNSQNHDYDAERFIDSIPMDRVAYIHMAGHWCREDDLIIDTHGMPVCESVWKLLEYTLQKREIPCLLERDNNIPPLDELLEEYRTMKRIHTHARS